MKAAKLTRSDRLQRVLAVLMDYRRHTTRDIIRNAHVCAVNSIISELRSNGVPILCERKGNKWFYELAVD